MGTEFGYGNEDIQDFMDLEVMVDAMGKGKARPPFFVFLFISVLLIGLLTALVFWNSEDIRLIYGGNHITVSCKKGDSISGIYDGSTVKAEYLDNNGKLKLTYLSASGASITAVTIVEGCAINDENGNLYVVLLSKTLLSASIREKITVYYYGDNIADARTLTTVWLWILSYCTLVPSLVFSVISLFKPLHKTKHSKALQS